MQEKRFRTYSLSHTTKDKCIPLRFIIPKIKVGSL